MNTNPDTTNPVAEGYERHWISVGGKDYVSDIPIGYTLVQTSMWYKASAAATLLADLDRCVHGRHEGDVCSNCGGPSRGNPHAPAGTIIGTNLSGWPIVVPSAKTDEGRRRSIGDSSLWAVKP